MEIKKVTDSLELKLHWKDSKILSIFPEKTFILIKLEEQMSVVTLICFQLTVQSSKIIEKSFCVSVETTGQIIKACNCNKLKYVGEWGGETNIFQNPQTQQRFPCHLHPSPS